MCSETTGIVSAADATRAASLAYWTGRADEYSELHEAEFASERGQAFARLVGRLPGVVPGARVLDLGCGSGLVSILAASCGCAVTGVDFSDAMVERAHANARAHGVGDATEFVQADVHELPFADETFDAVVTRNVTWVLEDVARVYAEVVRVLRSGGTFANMDANYGKAFNEADERGEVPAHPTQTLEQLRTRNRIARDLPITHAERPLWDLATLWDLGVGHVACYRDLDALLDAAGAGRDPFDGAFSRASSSTKARMFLVFATK